MVDILHTDVSVIGVYYCTCFYLVDRVFYMSVVSKLFIAQYGSVCICDVFTSFLVSLFSHIRTSNIHSPLFLKISVEKISLH